MKAIQLESQKAFRRAVHGVLGIPYGLPENKKNKTMTNEAKLWQRRAGLLSEGDYMEAIDKPEEELELSDEPAAAGGDKPVTSGTTLATNLVKTGRDLQSNADARKGIGTTEAQIVASILRKVQDAATTPENRTALLRQIDMFIDNKLKLQK